MIKHNSPYVVAEAGCNHLGKFEIAQQMVFAAKDCGVQAVKFQKRCPKELLTPEQYKAPHPNQHHAYGDTYGSHREYLELSIEKHRQLSDLCKQIGVTYSTSVWDLTSAKQVVELINPAFIKIPSACNNHESLLTYLLDKYAGELHISLGMTTQDEYAAVKQMFFGIKNRVVLYHCTSGYPVPFHKLFLQEISSLVEEGWSKVGFSGHHLGIAVDVAAYALGAIYIERHFTLDRTWKGTDHAASLEPSGMHKLCRDLVATQAALAPKPKVMDAIELEQRHKLKYRGD